MKKKLKDIVCVSLLIRTFIRAPERYPRENSSCCVKTFDDNKFNVPQTNVLISKLTQ